MPLTIPLCGNNTHVYRMHLKKVTRVQLLVLYPRDSRFKKKRVFFGFELQRRPITLSTKKGSTFFFFRLCWREQLASEYHWLASACYIPKKSGERTCSVNNKIGEYYVE